MQRSCAKRTRACISEIDCEREREQERTSGSREASHSDASTCVRAHLSVRKQSASAQRSAAPCSRLRAAPNTVDVHKRCAAAALVDMQRGVPSSHCK